MHLVPKLGQLALDKIKNGTPITFMKGIECGEKVGVYLSFVSQGTGIEMQDKIHKLELWRELGLVGAVAVIIGMESLTHVFNDIWNIERGGKNCKLVFHQKAHIMALKSSDDVRSGHLNVDTING
jgi:hypothetical protein